MLLWLALKLHSGRWLAPVNLTRSSQPDIDVWEMLDTDICY